MKKHYREFLEVYYCASFFAYSASFLAFFWELPSLLLRFSLSDILGLLSYQLAFTFLESLMITVLALVIVYLLPLKAIRGQYSTAGSLFVIFFALSGLIFRLRTEIAVWLTSGFLLSALTSVQVFQFIWLFTALGLPVLAIGFIRFENFSNRLRFFIENLATLANIYTVMSMVGMLIVLYRNLS